jgi:hypothetical protein
MKGQFVYVIKVGKKEVWQGLNPKQKFIEIKDKNKGKKVSISWRTKEDVLVCVIL